MLSKENAKDAISVYSDNLELLDQIVLFEKNHKTPEKIANTL